MSFMHNPELAIELTTAHRDRLIAARAAQQQVQIARQAQRQARTAEQIARFEHPGVVGEWLPEPQRQHTDSIFVLLRVARDFVRDLVETGSRSPGVRAR